MTDAPQAGKSPVVAIVAPMPPPNGGMSLQAEKLALRLGGDGISVRVVATNPALPRVLRFCGFIPGLRTLIRELQFLTAVIVNLPRAPVVHHFSASGLYFFLHSVPTVGIARLCGKRVLINYRGGKADSFLRRWAWFVVPVLRSASAVAVPSQFLKDVFQKYGIVAVLLPNLADVELFHWNERGSFRPRLLVTRNLEPMYNVECVLRAFRIVKQRYSDATLGIAGSGSEEGRLRRLVSNWKLDGVTFYGAVPNRQLAAIYAEYDIFVNSSNVDNFPGALVEAACCGLPIVTTRAGGIPDMIVHDENGLLVNLDDSEALAAAAMSLVEDGQRGRRLARSARQWAEQFSWEKIFPEYLRLYGFEAVPARQAKGNELLAHVAGRE